VQLHGEARTGLEEVNSNENECASMVGTIRGNVFALENSHVRHYVVEIAVVVLCGV